jgi:hypothetical protein
MICSIFKKLFTFFFLIHFPWAARAGHTSERVIFEDEIVIGIVALFMSA